MAAEPTQPLPEGQCADYETFYRLLDSLRCFYRVQITQEVAEYWIQHKEALQPLLVQLLYAHAQT